MAHEYDIPTVVVQDHVTRLCALMKSNDIAATIVFHPSNMLAFVGTTHSAWDRLVCAAITRDGEILVICPEFERPSVLNQTALPTMHTWLEHEDAYAKLASALGGAARGKVALDGRTWIDTRERFAAALPDAELISAEPLLREVRICKTPAELKLMQAAHDRGERIYPELAKLIAPGKTEAGLHQQIARHFADNLQMVLSPMIQTGPNGAEPHHGVDDSPLQTGHTLVVDSVTRTHGYHNDLTRTFAIGEPSARAKQAYKVVRAAQFAAAEAAKPGLTCGELDGVARKVITDAGFGQYFTHRLGHGIGIECHEPPYLVGNNDEPLRSGMCVTLEPGIYVPGEFGIRIEDDVIITETGCEFIKGELKTDVTDAFDG